MFTKSLLAIAVFAALSATAHAGSTISDRSYWPNEARQSTQSNASQQGPASAFAFDRELPAQPAASSAVGASGWRYQGGPKSH